MEIDENIARLIADLEFQIGKECYNSMIYNSWIEENPSAFRYPVNVETEDIRRKIGGRISETYGLLNKEEVYSLTYKFGTNRMYIGRGVINILNELEERYGLDFNELEKARNNR